MHLFGSAGTRNVKSRHACKIGLEAFYVAVSLGASAKDDVVVAEVGPDVAASIV